MRADISICVHRSPDFFALNRLEGEAWEVAVAESSGGAVRGCVAMARRTVWIDGRPQDSAYVGDLKVHPRARGKAYADALCGYATDWCRQIRPDLPCLITVLGGNRAMDRRIRLARSIPPCTLIGTVRVHTVPLLRRRRVPRDGARVLRACPADVAEMSELWGRVAPGRQFAPVLDADGLGRWIDAAPGLRIGDYRIVRGSNGRIEGFLALWDQRLLKQLHVVDLTRRGRAFRMAFNGVAPLVGALRMPEVGQAFRTLAAVHVCVPGDRPEVLRSLLRSASREYHGRYSFFTIGLDVRDPLSTALGLFRSLPADVAVYATSPDGTYTGPRDGRRPIHFETALV
jgi:hypothetical protein